MRSKELSGSSDEADPVGFSARSEGVDGPHEEPDGRYRARCVSEKLIRKQIAQKIQKLINAGIIKTR